MKPALILLVLLSILPIALAQAVTASSPSLDGRTLLTAAVGSMAASIPADCTASGMAIIDSGGRTETGSITVLTSGYLESVESVQTDTIRSRTVFSNGDAQDADVPGPISLEGSQSRQTAIFPLPLLTGLLADPEVQVQNLGIENVGGTALIHLRAQKSFASTPKLASVSQLSRKDIWIDPTSYLPRKISFVRSEGLGTVAGIQIDLYFSDYRTIQGVQFPFLVLKSLNGTPWGTFKLQSVLFNTGIPATTFAIQQTGVDNQ